MLFFALIMIPYHILYCNLNSLRFSILIILFSYDWFDLFFTLHSDMPTNFTVTDDSDHQKGGHTIMKHVHNEINVVVQKQRRT